MRLFIHSRVVFACVAFTFSACAFGDAQIIKAKDYGSSWPFQNESGGTLWCKDLGNGRKAVWLVADTATYALNGQAMTWMTNSGIKGVGGAPVKIGRDHSTNYGGLSKLIKDGLKLCK